VLIRGQPIVAQHESGCGTSRHLGAAQLLGRFRSEADINPGEGSQNRIYEYTALTGRDERAAELRREFPPRRLKGPCDGLPVLAQPGNGGPGPENAGAV